MNVVIYARFSSHNQHETSIEGQLKECYEYAHHNKITRTLYVFTGGFAATFTL